MPVRCHACNYVVEPVWDLDIGKWRCPVCSALHNLDQVSGYPGELELDDPEEWDESHPEGA